MQAACTGTAPALVEPGGATRPRAPILRRAGAVTQALRAGGGATAIPRWYGARKNRSAEAPMKIADLMTKDVVSCRTTDSLNRAAQLMWDRRCGCVPVLDETDQLAGMLTDRDVCMAAYTQGKRIEDIAATTAMSRPAWTCTPSTSAEEAEDLMMAHGVRRLAVVDDGRLVGVVSLDDIARSGAEWDGKSEIDLERVALALGEISRRTTARDGERTEGNAPEPDLTELVKNSLAALRTLRDEIRVDLNLAGKEARDRWRRLEVRLQAAEAHARATRREGARSFEVLVENARQFRKTLREKAATAARAR
jgi:CBS domain-containing protein